MIQINKFDSYKIDLKKQKLRFRLQFKYLESKDLKSRDEEAYKYYLKQVTLSFCKTFHKSFCLQEPDCVFYFHRTDWNT